MLRSVLGRLSSLRLKPAVSAAPSNLAFFSTAPDATSSFPVNEVTPEDRPYLHHGHRPRFRDYVKFKSPRKRASKLLLELNQEAMTQSKAAKPAVWDTDFAVGDAVELEVVTQGGANSETKDKMRGVVLGIFRKKMDYSILIRDVLFGEPVERRIPLHSPLVKSLKVLQKNFVHKGRKRIRRAKLYYLSDRNPLLTQVTGSKYKG